MVVLKKKKKERFLHDRYPCGTCFAKDIILNHFRLYRNLCIFRLGFRKRVPALSVINVIFGSWPIISDAYLFLHAELMLSIPSVIIILFNIVYFSLHSLANVERKTAVYSLTGPYNWRQWQHENIREQQKKLF